MDTTNSQNDTSPFHSGEKKLQARAGVREQMERFGQRVIRDHMPEQHRSFYRQLPFVFVGHADAEGWPWASIMFNSPGFISSQDEQSLSIEATPVLGDPLLNSLSPNLKLGLLGIELTTRRRNRLSAKVKEVSENKLELDVIQAFGNCPQYIQTRSLTHTDASLLPPPEALDIEHLDAASKNLIHNSDTFFVASHANDDSEAAHQGADVSHRGGRPGFIRIDDERTLTIPDYIGNNHFNTLGNFEVNNKAGLLFLDFEKGHLLTLSGTVEIVWDSPEANHFEGAERLWRFKLVKGRYLKNVLPLRWSLDEFSPNTALTGTWEEAHALEQAEKLKDTWQPYRVRKIERESEVISSFYLEALNHQPIRFFPGQFLTLKATIENTEYIRTYTLSNSPSDPYYRISVKREDSQDGVLPEGTFSNFLHQSIQPGDTLYALSPRGQFTFDASIERPALLIAAGVGITPMISMARHALIEGLRTRSTRPITFIGAAKTHDTRAFFKEFSDIMDASQKQIRAYWSLSEVNDSLVPGVDFHHKGRLSKELIQAILPQDDYDVYICGPSEFMQSTYDLLRMLGFNDDRIFAESFGPASLRRQTSKQETVAKDERVAEEAIVEFSSSDVEQAWTRKDGPLLNFAESHGFSPEFSCRNGQCGACKTELIEGKVSYIKEPIAAVNNDEVLLCCAVPAKTDGALTRIKINL